MASACSLPFCAHDTPKGRIRAKDGASTDNVELVCRTSSPRVIRGVTARAITGDGYLSRWVQRPGEPGPLLNPFVATVRARPERGVAREQLCEDGPLSEPERSLALRDGLPFTDRP